VGGADVGKPKPKRGHAGKAFASGVEPCSEATAVKVEPQEHLARGDRPACAQEIDDVADRGRPRERGRQPHSKPRADGRQPEKHGSRHGRDSQSGSPSALFWNQRYLGPGGIIWASTMAAPHGGKIRHVVLRLS